MTTTTLPSGTGIVTSNTYDDADRLTGIEPTAYPASSRIRASTSSIE